MHLATAAGLAGLIWTGPGAAEPVWLQIEAQPSLPQAEERARDWAGMFPDIAGFAMSTGWYAIAIGPFADTAEATARLRTLRREGLIPGDSYVSDGGRFRGQFWPNGTAPLPGMAGTPAPEAPAPETAPETTRAETTGAEPPPAEAPPAAPEIAAAPEPVTPVETLAESQRLEAGLDREARMEIQAALEWQGFYNATIDGAFGRGTRAAIAAWQAAQGFAPTGVLASAQQTQLLAAVAADRAALGLETVEETDAGIAIDLPLGLVEFDRYDPPFVIYRAKDGSGVTALLLSQTGDQNALYGLYDRMQTLALVPAEGERSRNRSGFTISGQSDSLHSWTEAHLAGGLIKGFTLAWPPGQEAKMARVLAAMKASFRPIGSTALDPSLGTPMTVTRGDLMAGLERRHPEFARSGAFIDDKGAVLTAGAGLDACTKITIEDEEAELAFADPALGIAVLRPKKPLAPAGIVTFETAPTAPGAQVAVAGFSYPEALTAPVLSFGTLSDLTGLAGEAGRARLAVHTLAGDAGGPVLDGSGALVGVVLPRAVDGTKLTPADLTEAVQAMPLVQVLAEHGFMPTASEATGTLAAEDLAVEAQKFTVQIACWK